jgi:hypothetical protein
MPTADTAICITQKFFHDDVARRRRYDHFVPKAQEYFRGSRFCQMHNLNREDSHGTKELSCWYHEGNMKYVSIRTGPPHPCRLVHDMFLIFEPTSFALVTQFPTTVFKLPLDDKALVPAYATDLEYLSFVIVIEPETSTRFIKSDFDYFGARQRKLCGRLSPA